MDRLQVQQLIENTLKNFTIHGTCMREYYPHKEGDRDSCFLWSYFAATGMLYHAVKAGYPFKKPFKDLIDGFVYYRSEKLDNGLIKYHSERGEGPNGGKGPCFFDDNIWTARNYLFAYEIFKEERYLQEARLITEYVGTAWNKELGGLVWNENGLSDNATVQELERGLSANACASLVNSILYKITDETKYLDWAKCYHEFCKKMQDDKTRIYYNGIHTVIKDGKRYNGEINKDMYSYNTGSMILANLELYHITGDKTYFEDAMLSSGAAYRYFIQEDEKRGLLYPKDFIWFTAILAEGWKALACEGSSRETEYLSVLKNCINYSLKYINDEGLLPHDLVLGWRNDDDYDRMLLTHSGIAEISVIANQM